MAQEPDIDALSVSVAQRLKETPWAHMESPDEDVRESLHNRVSLIREDLAKIARVDPNRALRIWDLNVPDEKERQAEQPALDRPADPDNTISDAIGRKRRARAASGLKQGEKDMEGAEQTSDLASPSEPATERSEDRQAQKQADRQRMLLENLHKRYLIAGDTYHFRDKDQALAFSAEEKKLVTRLEDPAVITSMLDLAETRGWVDINLTGTQDFKREAWLQTQLRGMKVKGYKPDRIDLARLEDQKTEYNRQGRGHSTGVDRAQKTGKGFEGKDIAAGNEPRPELTRGQQQIVQILETVMADRGDSPEAIARAKELATERFRNCRIHVGKLVETGTAPYQDKTGEKHSHFVTLEDEQGKRSKVWGVDLPRAVEASGAQVGDKIVLAFAGQKPVTVDMPVQDSVGKIVGYETKEVIRNSWDAARFDRLREDARVRVNEAVKSADNPSKLKIYDKGLPSRIVPQPVKLPQRPSQEKMI
ncbi:LPD7 domain-containing protein [Asticcacaulis tiandongensis]|uniref:LPD7 domain-containing protein n=1 Tax=Asticcacaulis tiandongensis TaxID=2565365 RepID=UPI0011297380|nr:LPD7 domain-containing protein [Asticcacaulis tiandongensis]